MFINKKEFRKYTILPDYLKDYSRLLDSMKEAEVKEKFKEFLEGIDQAVLQWKFEQLCELDERQFYTYEMLDAETTNKIEAFILENIDYECYEIVDTVIVIVLRLGMKNLFDKIYLNLKNIKSDSIKTLIIETRQEYYSTLEDPYIGYKKSNRNLKNEKN